MNEPVPAALVIEDERDIRRFVRVALEEEGWEVAEAASLGAAVGAAASTRYDLVILDLGLPDGDGLDFVKRLRTWSTVPVLVLSARAAEADKIELLDAGADDYLVKPFSIGELLARTRALLRRRRSGDEPASLIRFGRVELDRSLRQVRRDDLLVHLTPIEYRLLVVLVEAAGKVLTHRHLLREVWGPAHANHNHYLRVVVGRLRRKLEDEPARPAHLVTETGVGYRFQG